MYQLTIYAATAKKSMEPIPALPGLAPSGNPIMRTVLAQVVRLPVMSPPPDNATVQRLNALAGKAPFAQYHKYKAHNLL